MRCRQTAPAEETPTDHGRAAAHAANQEEEAGDGVAGRHRPSSISSVRARTIVLFTARPPVDIERWTA
jgi:hypothetical protein